MQKCLLLLSVIFFVGGLRAQCENVNPDCTILSDFECQTNYVGLLAVVNPVMDVTNGSAMAGEYNDQNDPYDALIIDFGGPLDLTTNNILKLKIYTTVGPTGRLLAKLEGGTSTPLELAKGSITNNAWTEYVFDFSSQATENHTRIILFFNADISRDNGPEVYLLDDMRWDDNGSATDPCTGVTTNSMILNDFECQRNEPFQACFPVVDNPLINVDNSSAKVGCFTDTGAEFDNIFIQFDGAINLSTNNQFRIKVKTDVAGNLMAKLEGGTSPAKEVPATVVGTGDWETQLFDFSSEATANHTRLVLFFNAGVVPGAGEKYFIDDLSWEAALPAALIAFDAIVVKDDVALLWATATESAVAEYTVEHATETTTWAPVGALSAAGDSQTERRYTITHKQPGAGRHFYRLTMKDFDGTVTFSDVTMVDLVDAAAVVVLQAYPNPFSDELIIPFSTLTVGPVLLELTDALGRTVVQQKEVVSPGKTLLRLRKLGEISAGHYVLRVVHAGRTFTLPVVRR